MSDSAGIPAKGIITDILLWVALATLLSLGWQAWHNSHPHGEVLHLSFQDANEISKGAMVRMMGTEIGFVDKVEIQQDRVHLVVRTYPDALPIPSGSVASILFTGLVGSKSIEIIPPNVPRPTRGRAKQILTEDPVRLKDTLNYQMDVTQAMQSGAENISDFFGKKKPVEELQFNIRTAHRKITNAGDLLANGNRNIRQIGTDLHNGLDNMNETFADMNSAALVARHLTRPEKMDASIHRALNSVMLGFLESQAVLTGMRVSQTMHKINGASAQLSGQIARAHLRARGFPLDERLQRVQDGSEAFYRWSSHMESLLSRTLPAWEQARASIQAWGDRFARWDRRLQDTPPNVRRGNGKAPAS